MLRASAVTAAVGGLALAACDSGEQERDVSGVAMVAGDSAALPSATVEAVKRPLIQDGKLVVVPGVYDVLSAKIAERVGP